MNQETWLADFLVSAVVALVICGAIVGFVALVLWIK
jgi:hypothetical protein